MPPLLSSILDQVHLNTIVDIGITALLIYWLFKLIRGTRAVRLVIGVSVLVLVYFLALFFDLHLLTQILQAGAVVGLFALLVAWAGASAPWWAITALGGIAAALSGLQWWTVAAMATAVSTRARRRSGSAQPPNHWPRRTGVRAQRSTWTIVHEAT
jgi:DNA integrity scanning protein DisA with diadenylate cyclase activity